MTASRSELPLRQGAPLHHIYKAAADIPSKKSVIYLQKIKRRPQFLHSNNADTTAPGPSEYPLALKTCR